MLIIGILINILAIIGVIAVIAVIRKAVLDRKLTKVAVKKIKVKK